MDKRIAFRCELNSVIQRWGSHTAARSRAEGVITLGIRAGGDCRSIRITYRIAAEKAVNWRPCCGSECNAALGNGSEVERVVRAEHCLEPEDNGIS